MFKSLKKGSKEEIEKSFTDYWKKIDVLNASIAKGKDYFVFYDGPATANGFPGLHHIHPEDLLSHNPEIYPPDEVFPHPPQIQHRYLFRSLIKNAASAALPLRKVPRLLQQPFLLYTVQKYCVILRCSQVPQAFLPA